MTKRRQHYANIIRNFGNCPEAGAVNMEAYVDSEIERATSELKNKLKEYQDAYQNLSKIAYGDY